MNNARKQLHVIDTAIYIPLHSSAWSLITMKYAPLLSLITIIILASGGVSAWAECENDAKQSLHDMITGDKKFSQKVPSDFKIDQTHLKFRTKMESCGLEEYRFPSDAREDNLILDHLGSCYTTFENLKAECRVQGPDGRWWLVERDQKGYLSYILESMAAEK